MSEMKTRRPLSRRYSRRQPASGTRKIRKDGWGNLITGLNAVSIAKKVHTRHTLDVLLSDEELESIYIDDGLGARIVNLLPSDMFREGWNYTFPDMDEIKAAELEDKYKEAMETIEAQQKIKEAVQWARLYGGSVILIGALDGRTMEKPLDPKKIKTDGLEKLRVIDRSDIDFQEIQFQFDPAKPRYGLPEYYPIKSQGKDAVSKVTLVHHSRIIEIHGDRLPSGATRTLTPEQRYWGISVLQHADDHLKTLGASMGSIDQLLQEMSVGKYKLKDLAQLLSSPEGKSAIERRVQLMDLTRSVFRSQYFDTEEDFSRDSVNFSGVPELLHIIFMLIAADTGYPITRLFGVSPAGMNATGESDMRNYYDMVRSEQNAILQPVLLRLVRIISVWQGIEEPYIEFVPLQTMNDKEQADLEKQKADTEQVKANTYKTYIDSGVIEPYEARWLEFGDTLDKIPVPEDMLPEVETVNEPSPEEPPDGEVPESGEDEAGEGDNGETDNEDEPEETEGKDIEVRIAELRKKKELTEEEQSELEELEKKLKGKKGKKK